VRNKGQRANIRKPYKTGIKLLFLLNAVNYRLILLCGKNAEVRRGPSIRRKRGKLLDTA